MAWVGVMGPMDLSTAEPRWCGLLECSKSDSMALRVSPELGVSLEQLTGKKINKQQREIAYYCGKHQGLGVGTLGFYFLLSLTYCTEQESVKLQFLNLHA